MAALLAGAADWLGRACTQGRLLDLGEYPGLTVDSEGTVWGDCFRLHLEQTASILKRLDRYEGLHDPTVPYRRVERSVLLEDQTHFAWVYIYQGPVCGAEVIAGGDWLARD